ncbi:DUF1090 domain-containing protein [Vibrio anguillarum]|uniref:DUF1090 domain-containing protein n=1 Tax=Vibrio TaxID=662 RepID=UPI001D1829DF|nr:MULTISPECIES: DUF1090 domain-containing protein [Vibrio]MCC4238539.1 DUF1090 domain-containing protein [Vibrio anguillarum]MDT3848602.1 DUF1090 domain-containing protein [Vibrio anguillarum]UJQ42737.1 DUF1090 domain-containing protein [Vibrio anguillarum]
MKRANVNLMLKASGVVLSILSFYSFASLNCSGFSGCERKYCEIEQQIESAQLANNQKKIEGLKVALAEAKSNCSDTKLKQDLADEIKETKDKIAEYNLDLQEAKGSGKDNKVRKYQNKIQEEERKLESLLQELSELG